MNQSKLSDHVGKGQAIELCESCLKPITPYWHTVLIEPYEDNNKAIFTTERTCDHCGFTEQDQIEDVLICRTENCHKCIANCKGGLSMNKKPREYPFKTEMALMDLCPDHWFKWNQNRLNRCHHTALTASMFNEPIELNFSKKFTPEIHVDPVAIPDCVTIDGLPRCPNCGSHPVGMVGFAVVNGPSTTKNQCLLCGHVW